MSTLIIDNGASTIKAGYSSQDKPKVVPNVVFKCRSEKRRVFVADELDELQDKSKLYYMLPFERGYLVNWNVELDVWDRLFGADLLHVDFADTRLLLTDYNVIVPAFKDQVEEVIFETYQFKSLGRTTGPSLIAQWDYSHNGRPTTMVLDSGYSFSHWIPFCQGGALAEGIVCLNLGGKALTNQLKEWISYRQLDVRDETFVINECKEDACFVSTNFQADLDTCRSASNPISREYVLPDFLSSTRGTLQLPTKDATNQNQKILMGKERFALPELLFHPSDIGVNEAGLAECFAQSLTEVNSSFPELAARLPENIITVGGNVLFNGFGDRLAQDLQQWVGQGSRLNLAQPDSPITHAWQCAQNLVQAADPQVEAQFISREEYLEHGESICQKRANNLFFSF